MHQPETITAPDELSIRIGGNDVPMRLFHNPRARRYILRITADGAIRVTIPRGGSAREARAFAEAQRDWLARQANRRPEPPLLPLEWTEGTQVLYHGTWLALDIVNFDGRSAARLGGLVVPIPDSTIDNVRPHVEAALRRQARQALSARTTTLAARHGFSPSRITIRGQRSRWGSCSPRGTISLNWRLIHAPQSVQDYLIIHELCHLKELNHSPRFWRKVAALCPAHRESEAWLRRHQALITG